jgi:hypothetical protein
MKTLTVKLPDRLFFEIAGQAQARNISKSDVVRERLAKHAGPSRRRHRSSLWSQMEDVVIDCRALPRDLSVNKKHLRGYGQNHPHR